LGWARRLAGEGKGLGLECGGGGRRVELGVAEGLPGFEQGAGDALGVGEVGVALLGVGGLELIEEEGVELGEAEGEGGVGGGVEGVVEFGDDFHGAADGAGALQRLGGGEGAAGAGDGAGKFLVEEEDELDGVGAEDALGDVVLIGISCHA